MEVSGVTLLSYIPYASWIVRVRNALTVQEIANYNIAWVGAIDAEMKIDGTLKRGEFFPWAYVGDYHLLHTCFHDDIEMGMATEILDTLNTVSYNQVEGLNAFIVEITFEDIEQLAALDEVMWIEQIPPPLEPCMAEAGPIVGADEVQAQPFGLTGAGVDVLVVAENYAVSRTHLDLQLPNTNSSRVLWADEGYEVECGSPSHSPHESMVGGIIAGNGAVNRGVAPGSYILSYLLGGYGIDPDALATNFCAALEGLSDGIVVHTADLANVSMNYNGGISYGGYGPVAELTDKLSLGRSPLCPDAKRFPLVWAAGNYGERYRTIGDAATGKNVICVGAVDDDLSYASFSSSGPTADGRVKPDLCAPGVAITSCDCETGYYEDDGTSFASPVVAGGVALIMERLREEHNIVSPRPDLLKSIVICSAKDQGNNGPDFRYGYGVLDLPSAIQCVDSGMFGSGTVTEDVAADYGFYIPENTQKFCVAVCWDDLPAVLPASVTLVNDITCILVPESGLDVLPLIHADPIGDPRPPAVNGVDVRNNVEYFIVESPLVTNWTLHIEGTGIVEDNDDNIGDGIVGQQYSYAVYLDTAIEYVNRSDPAFAHGLEYTGTPYSVVSWPYEGDEDTSPIDDLFVSISDAPSVTYNGFQMNSQGVPQYEALESYMYVGGVEPPIGLRGLAVGEIDHDSVPGLFAAHATTPRLYRWNPVIEKMEDISAATGIDVLATESTAGSWGDYDRDGDLDLFVSRATGYVEDPAEMEEARISPASRLLKNVPKTGGGREFVGAGSSTGIADDLSSACTAWGYYDDDGYIDLFVGTFGAPGSQLYRNLGNGSFENVTNNLGQNWVRTRVTGCVWEDLNGDQIEDLLVSHYYPTIGESEQIDVFYGSASGIFSDGQGNAPPYRLGSREGYSGIAAYDYNVDSLQDILALSDDANRGPDLFENRSAPQGNPVFVNMAPSTGLIEPDGTGVGYIHGVVIADLGDGSDNPGPAPDGIPDLLLGRPVSSEDFLYLARRHEASAAHFVKIRLTSPSASDNWLGIGAKVTVNAGGQYQLKIVDGGSMRGGQAGRELIFGLGPYDGAVNASVQWPSGVVQPVVPLLLDQLNVIVNAPVEVDDSTVTATYEAHPGNITDWYFTWETNSIGDPAYDMVIFDMPGIPPQCQPVYSAIDSTTEDVTLSVVAKSAGGYRHQIIWENPPCVPGCSIGFWVSSGSIAQADTSDVLKTLKIKVCTN